MRILRIAIPVVVAVLLVVAGGSLATFVWPGDSGSDAPEKQETPEEVTDSKTSPGEVIAFLRLQIGQWAKDLVTDNTCEAHQPGGAGPQEWSVRCRSAVWVNPGLCLESGEVAPGLVACTRWQPRKRQVVSATFKVFFDSGLVLPANHDASLWLRQTSQNPYEGSPY